MITLSCCEHPVPLPYCLCQPVHTFMTVHSEKPPFISTPYKLWKAPVKASAKSFDGNWSRCSFWIPEVLCSWIFFCSFQIFVFSLCFEWKQALSPKAEHRGENLTQELKEEFIRSYLLSSHICLTFEFLFSITV